MSDIITDLTAVVQDVDPIPARPSTTLIDQMIEKTREQKVSVMDIHLSFVQKYGYGYKAGEGRQAEFRDKDKITQRKWDAVRKRVKAIMINLERRIELLTALREHSENGAFDKKTA